MFFILSDEKEKKKKQQNPQQKKSKVLLYRYGPDACNIKILKVFQSLANLFIHFGRYFKLCYLFIINICFKTLSTASMI